MFGTRFLFKLMIVVVLVVIVVGAVAYATTGTTEDPLISLSYLEKTFKPAIEQQLSPMIESAKNELSVSFEKKVDELADALRVSVANSAGQEEIQPDNGYITVELAAGQSIEIGAGAQVLFLSGAASITSGSVTDTTAGEAQQAEFTVNHLYLTATVSTANAGEDGASLLINGVYTVS